MSKFFATAAASSGVPSEKVTSSRRLKVYSVASVVHRPVGRDPGLDLERLGVLPGQAGGDVVDEAAVRVEAGLRRVEVRVGLVLEVGERAAGDGVAGSADVDPCRRHCAEAQAASEAARPIATVPAVARRRAGRDMVRWLLVGREGVRVAARAAGCDPSKLRMAAAPAQPAGDPRRHDRSHGRNGASSARVTVHGRGPGAAVHAEVVAQRLALVSAEKTPRRAARAPAERVNASNCAGWNAESTLNPSAAPASRHASNWSAIRRPCRRRSDAGTACATTRCRQVTADARRERCGRCARRRARRAALPGAR